MIAHGLFKHPWAGIHGRGEIICEEKAIVPRSGIYEWNLRHAWTYCKAELSNVHKNCQCVIAMKAAYTLK